MNVSNQIRQYDHEITWIEKKIKSKENMKSKELKDLKRQIRERELFIAFLSDSQN